MSKKSTKCYNYIVNYSGVTNMKGIRLILVITTMIVTFIPGISFADCGCGNLHVIQNG